MKIIDFHAHIYPADIADKATKSICEFYGLYEEEHKNKIATAETLLEEGRNGGIDSFVILPVAIKPEQVSHINDFAVREAAEHKEFYPFGTLHAAMDDPLTEIERIASKVKGIKFHPDTQRFPIDDERLFPAYDMLQGRLPVLFHCGDKRFDYSHPSRLKRVLKEFPRLTVIAAHMGGYSIFDEGMELLCHENCFFDISSSIMFLGKEKSVEYVRKYGAERIVFGSDFPLWKPSEEKERFLGLCLTDRENELILSETALNILNGKVLK